MRRVCADRIAVQGRIWLFIAALLTISGRAPARAQTSPPAEAPPAGTAVTEAQHQWLRVTSDNVNLRSRADLNSLIVSRVSQGTMLESTGSDNGWRVIVPPPGVFSIVSAQFVESVDETHGRVNVDTSLRVRVGSDVQAYDPMLCEVQTHLKRGDEVEILGHLNPEWLKIKPPAGVYVYISGDYVEEIPEEEAGRLRANKIAQNAETTAEPTQADITIELPPAAAPTETADLTGPWGQKLAELQREIEQMCESGKDQHDWEAVLGKLRPIAQQTEEPRVAELAADWLKKVEQQAQEEQATDESAGAAPAETALIKSEPPAPKSAASDRTFDATGILRPSFALPVGPHGLRYRLIKPGTTKVTAYIEIPVEVGVNIKDCVEKYVGVKGAPVRLDDPKVTILRVTQMTVLGRQPEARKTP